MLQQKTGLIPFRIQGHLFPLYKKSFQKHAKSVKLLFIVGTSLDIRGQIAAFRQINPDIKIVALLFDEEGTIPTYMKSGDNVIFGDAHQILPQIVSYLR